KHTGLLSDLAPSPDSADVDADAEAEIDEQLVEQISILQVENPMAISQFLHSEVEKIDDEEELTVAELLERATVVEADTEQDAAEQLMEQEAPEISTKEKIAILQQAAAIMMAESDPTTYLALRSKYRALEADQLRL